MQSQQIKKIQIEPKDFSDRDYFPGTPGHPFHTIEKFQSRLAKIPFPFYAFFFGGVIFILSGDVSKSLLIAGFFILDWVLLYLLPFFQLSYGPPTFTSLVLAILRSPFLLFSFTNALIFQIFGTLLVLYAFYIEPHYPRINHYSVRLPKNQETKKELRIVHLSDLHMEFLTKREERAIALINSLSPDLILFTGDFFNLSYQDHPKTHKDIKNFFAQLRSNNGIYAVTGSLSVDQKQYLSKIFPDPNVILLQDQVVEFEINDTRIQLIGLSCTHQPGKDFDRLDKLLGDEEDIEPKTKILLYHSPDISPHLQSLPIDLQLSGHTHGGQVQIPFFGPIFTGSLYGHSFSSGHYLVNRRLNLIISRGLGLEGEAAPRVRFLSPPDISDISLEISDHHVE